MAKLTSNELLLYKTCFDGINNRYQDFIKYDNQIINLLNGEFYKLETEDLKIFLDMVGYSKSRVLIIEELQHRENLEKYINKSNQ